MALIRLILNGFWHSNTQIDIFVSREYDGIIRVSHWHLVLPLSVKQHWRTKIGWDIFVDRPFFNRKHPENGHLDPFPYKSLMHKNIPWEFFVKVW